MKFKKGQKVYIRYGWLDSHEVGYNKYGKGIIVKANSKERNNYNIKIVESPIPDVADGDTRLIHDHWLETVPCYFDSMLKGEIK